MSDGEEITAARLAAQFEVMLDLIHAGREVPTQERFNVALRTWMRPIEENAASLLVWLEAEKNLGGDVVLIYATHLRQSLDRISSQIDAVARKLIDPQGYLDRGSDG